jgi:gas vesicle protein
VREIVGFVMGAAAGAAGALFATSTEGRALLERLKDEARPETERATTEWEPVLREVSRAVRLAVRELETATVDLRARIGEIAAAVPEDEAARAVPTLSSAAAEGDAPAAAPAVEAATVDAAVDEAPPAVDTAVGEPASAT